MSIRMVTIGHRPYLEGRGAIIYCMKVVGYQEGYHLKAFHQLCLYATLFQIIIVKVLLGIASMVLVFRHLVMPGMLPYNEA